MKNLILKVKVTIDVTFSNEEWKLLNSANNAEVADKLNSRLCQLINDFEFDKETTRLRMMAIMMANAQYGAYDSDSIEFLDQVLLKIFEFKNQHTEHIQLAEVT